MVSMSLGMHSHVENNYSEIMQLENNMACIMRNHRVLLKLKLMKGVQKGMIALQQLAFTSVLVRNDTVESLLIGKDTFLSERFGN